MVNTFKGHEEALFAKNGERRKRGCAYCDAELAGPAQLSPEIALRTVRV